MCILLCYWNIPRDTFHRRDLSQLEKSKDVVAMLGPQNILCTDFYLMPEILQSKVCMYGLQEKSQIETLQIQHASCQQMILSYVL